MKKRELKPMVEERKTDIDTAELKKISDQLERSVVVDKGEDSTETFYKNIVNHLYDKKDIETKTEYLNVAENFTGTKLSFLARFGNMPYLDKFVNIFERKRVSLERKGRKEIIMALAERRQEIEEQRTSQLRNVFGLQ